MLRVVRVEPVEGVRTGALRAGVEGGRREPWREVRRALLVAEVSHWEVDISLRFFGSRGSAELLNGLAPGTAPVEGLTVIMEASSNKALSAPDIKDSTGKRIPLIVSSDATSRKCRSIVWYSS